MKVYKAKANPLACRLLGQVLAERGREDRDNEALQAGVRLLKLAAKVESETQEAKNGRGPEKARTGQTTTNH